MREAGLAEVSRAKADGRWDAAYDSPGRIQVPADLQPALDARPAATAFFGELNPRTATRSCTSSTTPAPETRARRIATFVAMLERGERLH